MVHGLLARWLGGASAVMVVACGGASDAGLRGGAPEDAGAGATSASPDGGEALGGSAGAGASSTGGSSRGGTGAVAAGGEGVGGTGIGGMGAGGEAGTAVGGAGGAGGTTALVPCRNSLDCASDSIGRTICAPGVGLCVECASSSDCPGDADCLGNRCIAFDPCANSLDCALGAVCDTARGRCVACVGDSDCADTDVCVVNACVTACDSDNDCTSTGRLCDFSTGACAQCLGDPDCEDTEFCLTGSCVPDVCPAGATACTQAGVSSCSARGDGFAPLVPCGARRSCVEGPAGAACEPWVCTAGQAECQDATTAITCADDGLSVISSADCALSDEVCNAGACSELACSPNVDFCDQGTVRHCAADGLSSTLVDTCEVSEYCDTTDTTCKALLCTPNGPACDGSTATTCNAAGTGYASGGTDCATGGQSCVAGICQTCPGGDGPLEDVRLVEVFVGQADYVVVENTSASCPVDLSGLTLRASDTDAAADLSIGSFVLDPGQRALVSETGATTGADTVTSGLIDLNYTAGHVLLCIGACTTSGTPTVIDAMAYFNGTTQPPALPAPVTFSPIQGINSTNGVTTSFVRGAITGTYPNFQPSDWSTGPATRPDAQGATCPVTQPTGACGLIGAVCTYGIVTCTCALTWACG